MDIARIIKKTQKLVSDNSPTILTGVGVVGSITAAILTAKATFKAADVIQEAYDDQIDIHGSAQGAIESGALPLDVKEKTKRVWTLYLTPAGVLVLTCGSIIFAQKINMQRMAALAGMYSLTEKAYTDYKDKVIEKFGPEEEQKVREAIVKDKVNNSPIPDAFLADPLTGYQLMHEAMTGRYFWSTKAAVMNAANELYSYINHSDYAMIEEFYDKIGLEKTSVSDEMGWNCENPIELLFVAVEHKDGRTALSFEYKNMPIHRPDQFNKDETPKPAKFR